MFPLQLLYRKSIVLFALLWTSCYFQLDCPGIFFSRKIPKCLSLLNISWDTPVPTVEQILVHIILNKYIWYNNLHSAVGVYMYLKLPLSSIRYLCTSDSGSNFVGSVGTSISWGRTYRYFNSTYWGPLIPWKKKMTVYTWIGSDEWRYYKQS